VPNRPLEDGEWVDAAEYAVRRHDLRVQVLSARVGPVLLQQGQEKPAPSRTRHLAIQLAVVSEGARAPQLTYEPWADRTEGPSQHPPALADNLGRRYAQDTFDAGRTVAGRGDRTPFSMGWQVREILVFPVPQDGTEHL